jgi:hypothetical protein
VEPKLIEVMILQNADDSIRVNRELDSNEIDENDQQNKKHFEQRTSTLRGITID